MKRHAILFAAIFVVTSVNASQNSTWRPVDPGFRALAVAANGNTLWACGAGESIAKSDDNGAHWTVKHHQTPGATLLGMEMVGGQFGYAYGTAGTLLFTEDGGENWTAAKNAPGTVLMASFADRTHGLVRTRRELLFTTDGERWTPVSFQQNAEELKHHNFTYALAALDDQHFIALLKEGSAQYEGSILVSTIDGGQSWAAFGPPSTVIYGLLRRDGRYWLEGIEVVGKDKPGGGHSVPLLEYSSDGREWTHVKNDVSACQLELCTLCNASGCIAGNGALVRPFGDTTRLAQFEPLKELSPTWAATDTEICTAGSDLRCADLRAVDKIHVEGDTPLPTQVGISTPTNESNGGPQCLRCEMDHILVSQKAPQGMALLDVKFQMNTDGTVSKVEVSGAPSKDVEETVRVRIEQWLFDPVSSKPATVHTRVQLMVIHTK